MRRRRFLAALGTAASVGLAGCGYAFGGGDSRGEASVHPGGLGATPMYAVDDTHILAARSGDITVFEGESVEFTRGTELRLASRAGADRWWYTYRTESEAVALGDVVYLLDVEGRVVAVEGYERQREDDAGTTLDARQRWRTAVGGARSGLAASGATAYVTTEGGVVAVRDGGEQWRTTLPSTPTTVLATGDGVVVSGRGTTVLLDRTGDERWTADGELLLARDERVYLQTPAGDLAAYTARGRRRWTVETPATISAIDATSDEVVVAGTDSLTVFAADGTERWRATGVGAGEVVVPAPEGTYLATRAGTVVAVGPDGRRWERVEDDHRRPVAGWLDGQRVAFLFQSGRIRWFQRTDQSKGLLSGLR